MYHSMCMFDENAYAICVSVTCMEFLNDSCSNFSIEFFCGGSMLGKGGCRWGREGMRMTANHLFLKPMLSCRFLNADGEVPERTVLSTRFGSHFLQSTRSRKLHVSQALRAYFQGSLQSHHTSGLGTGKTFFQKYV